MPIRKSTDIANESHGTFDRVKSARKITEITERFNDTKTDNILPGDEALSYLSKKIDECVDEINLNQSKAGISSAQASAITANSAKVGISSAQASAITVNSAKVGITVTDEYAVAFTVLESRGAYSLRFDVTGGEIEGTKTATLSLR
tara:strand:+ start:1633 stop:2073 length:441 start_codon:yes stop_codon:yes gene_type:complete